MKKLFQKMLAIALLSTTSLAIAAPVATLHSVSGDVIVERSGSMIPATNGIKLEQGDVIRALESGNATVKFGNCEVSMASSTLFSVDQAQQCELPIQKIGVGAALPAPALAAAAVFASVVVLAAVTNNNDDDPVSP